MTSSIPIGPRRAAMVGRLQAATVPIDVFQAQDRRRSVDAARRRELAGGNVNQAGQERPVSKALQGTKHYPTGVSLARENNLMRCHTPSVNMGRGVVPPPVPPPESVASVQPHFMADNCAGCHSGYADVTQDVNNLVSGVDVNGKRDVIKVTDLELSQVTEDDVTPGAADEQFFEVPQTVNWTAPEVILEGKPRFV